jgi:hypothetical protein
MTTENNLNFDLPILPINSYRYIFTSSSYTPIEGWTITAPVITDNEEENPIQYVSFLLGNGTGGPFQFTNIDSIPSSFTQYGIIQFSSDRFDGTPLHLFLSNDIDFTAVGDYLLSFYVQARPPNRGNPKYNEQHTIQATINNYSTENFSLGNEIGVWKKQELVFTITTVGLYPLTFTSSLLDFTGVTDSTLIFGSIVLQSL